MERDIDQLTKTKSYNMLNQAEKKYALTFFANEKEYNEYRNFILLSEKSVQSDRIPEADPGIELRVIEYMRLNGGNSQNRESLQQSLLGSLLGLFSIHSMGLKASFVMVGIIATITFSWNNDTPVTSDNKNDINLLSDSSLGSFQDSNFFSLDSSCVQSEL